METLFYTRIQFHGLGLETANFYIKKCMQAVLEEKARAAQEREVETARLRAAQQRMHDRQSELDELRARRCAPFLHESAAFHVILHASSFKLLSAKYTAD